MIMIAKGTMTQSAIPKVVCGATGENGFKPAYANMAGADTGESNKRGTKGALTAAHVGAICSTLLERSPCDQTCGPRADTSRPLDVNGGPLKVVFLWVSLDTNLRMRLGVNHS